MRPPMTVRRDITDLLAAHLAAGATIKDAARELGIGEKTARRRWADPAFKARVAELRREMTTRAVGRLADRMAAAADVLGALLDSPAEMVRLRAAVAILNAYRHVLASTPEPTQPTIDVSAATELIARWNVAQESRDDARP